MLTNQPNTKSLRYSLPAYIMLWMYILVTTVKYIKGFPVVLNSLTLYGFVALGTVAIFLNLKVRLNTHSTMMVAFFIICLVSCVYSKAMDVSFSTTIDLFKLVLFAVVFSNVVDSEKRIEGVFFAASLATVILFIYLAANDMLDTDQRLGNELTGNANTFASVFMVGAFGSVYLLFCREHRFRLEKLLYIAAFLVQEYAMALSGGRKFFILPVILLSGVLMMKTNKQGRRHIIRNALIAAGIITVAFWSIFEVEELYKTIGHRMEGLINSVSGEGKVDASTASRDRLAEEGVRLWLQAPLFGHGIDTFKKLNSYMYVYSHNNYTELLSGTGLLGTCVYYSFYLVVLYKLVIIKGKDNKKWFWLIAVLCLLIYDFGAVSYNDYLNHSILALAAVYVTTQTGEPTQVLVQEDIK